MLCLLDTVVKPGDRWLWNCLPKASDDEIDFVWVTARDRFPKWGKVIAYYPIYFLLAAKALRRMAQKDYDVVVAWEGKCGFPLALIRSAMGIRRPKMVILDYNQRGIITHFPTLTRFALKSVDRVTVETNWEAAHMAGLLGIPDRKVVFCLLGSYDVGAVPMDHGAVCNGNAIFTGGRSYRDYATLVASLADIGAKAVINARGFNLKGIQIPSNVVVNDILPAHQYWQQLKSSSFVVIPLHSIQHSGGEGVIVHAMAAGKAVIATRAPGPETYVEDGVTGILVPPYDVAKMKEAIEYLLGHEEEAVRMGCRARERFEELYTFPALAQRVHGILQEVCATG